MASVITHKGHVVQEPVWVHKLLNDPRAGWLQLGNVTTKTQKVLVPLDGSEFSRQILPHLRKVLSPAAHEIIFLYVGYPEQALSLVAAEWTTLAYRSRREANLARQESVQAKLEEGMRGDLQIFQDAGYKVSVALKFGADPAQVILDYIEEAKIDGVAMTTHGRTGLNRLISGSVADKVLHQASVPVILLCSLGHPSQEMVH